MSTKKCPFCAEEIQEEAIKCKHCGEMLGEQTTTSPSPPPVPSVEQQSEKMSAPGEKAAPSEAKTKEKTFLVVLFIFLLPFLVFLFFSPLLGFLAFFLAVGLGVQFFKETEPKAKRLVVTLCGVCALLLLGVVVNHAHQESVAQKAAERQAATNIPASSTVTSSAENILKSLGVDVSIIQLADGRANGGERVLIITYANRSGSESQRMVELTNVLEAGYAANNSLNALIDSVVAVVGDSSDNLRASVVVNVRDTEIFANTKDATAYMASWTVSLYDRSFIPVVADEMGW